MTGEEQDQALAAMGFRVRDGVGFGWKRGYRNDGALWHLYISPSRGRYRADMYYRGELAGRAPTTVYFDDPVSAAAYLLIQAADQP